MDLAGGDSFAGEMLILDQNGKLMAHNDIDDDEAYQKWEDKDKGKGTIKPATPPGTPPEARKCKRAGQGARQTASKTAQALVSRFSAGRCR